MILNRKFSFLVIFLVILTILENTDSRHLAKFHNQNVTKLIHNKSLDSQFETPNQTEMLNNSKAKTKLALERDLAGHNRLIHGKFSTDIQKETILQNNENNEMNNELRIKQLMEEVVKKSRFRNETPSLSIKGQQPASYGNLINKNTLNSNSNLHTNQIKNSIISDNERLEIPQQRIQDNEKNKKNNQENENQFENEYKLHQIDLIDKLLKDNDNNNTLHRFSNKNFANFQQLKQKNKTNNNNNEVDFIPDFTNKTKPKDYEETSDKIIGINEFINNKSNNSNEIRKIIMASKLKQGELEIENIKNTELTSVDTETNKIEKIVLEKNNTMSETSRPNGTIKYTELKSEKNQNKTIIINSNAPLNDTDTLIKYSLQDILEKVIPFANIQNVEKKLNNKTDEGIQNKQQIKFISNGNYDNKTRHKNNLNGELDDHIDATLRFNDCQSKSNENMFYKNVTSSNQSIVHIALNETVIPLPVNFIKIEDSTSRNVTLPSAQPQIFVKNKTDGIKEIEKHGNLEELDENKKKSSSTQSIDFGKLKLPKHTTALRQQSNFRYLTSTKDRILYFRGGGANANLSRTKSFKNTLPQVPTTKNTYTYNDETIKQKNLQNYKENLGFNEMANQNTTINLENKKPNKTDSEISNLKGNETTESGIVKSITIINPYKLQVTDFMIQAKSPAHNRTILRREGETIQNNVYEHLNLANTSSKNMFENKDSSLNFSVINQEKEGIEKHNLKVDKLTGNNFSNDTNFLTNDKLFAKDKDVIQKATETENSGVSIKPFRDKKVFLSVPVINYNTSLENISLRTFANTVNETLQNNSSSNILATNDFMKFGNDKNDRKSDNETWKPISVSEFNFNTIRLLSEQEPLKYGSKQENNRIIDYNFKNSTEILIKENQVVSNVTKFQNNTIISSQIEGKAENLSIKLNHSELGAIPNGTVNEGDKLNNDKNQAILAKKPEAAEKQILEEKLFSEIKYPGNQSFEVEPQRKFSTKTQITLESTQFVPNKNNNDTFGGFLYQNQNKSQSNETITISSSSAEIDKNYFTNFSNSNNSLEGMILNKENIQPNSKEIINYPANESIKIDFENEGKTRNKNSLTSKIRPDILNQNNLTVIKSNNITQNETNFPVAHKPTDQSINSLQDQKRDHNQTDSKLPENLEMAVLNAVQDSILNDQSNDTNLKDSNKTFLLENNKKLNHKNYSLTYNIKATVSEIENPNDSKTEKQLSSTKSNNEIEKNENLTSTAGLIKIKCNSPTTLNSKEINTKTIGTPKEVLNYNLTSLKELEKLVGDFIKSQLDELENLNKTQNLNIKINHQATDELIKRLKFENKLKTERDINPQTIFEEISATINCYEKAELNENIELSKKNYTNNKIKLNINEKVTSNQPIHQTFDKKYTKENDKKHDEHNSIDSNYKKMTKRGKDGHVIGDISVDNGNGDDKAVMDNNDEAKNEYATEVEADENYDDKQFSNKTINTKPKMEAIKSISSMTIGNNVENKEIFGKKTVALNKKNGKKQLVRANKNYVNDDEEKIDDNNNGKRKVPASGNSDKVDNKKFKKLLTTDNDNKANEAVEALIEVFCNNCLNEKKHSSNDNRIENDKKAKDSRNDDDDDDYEKDTETDEANPTNDKIAENSIKTKISIEQNQKQFATYGTIPNKETATAVVDAATATTIQSMSTSLMNNHSNNNHDVDVDVDADASNDDVANNEKHFLLGSTLEQQHKQASLPWSVSKSDNLQLETDTDANGDVHVDAVVHTKDGDGDVEDENENDAESNNDDGPTEITTTNWWHALPYAEIRKFLNTIFDSETAHELYTEIARKSKEIHSGHQHLREITFPIVDNIVLDVDVDKNVDTNTGQNKHKPSWDISIKDLWATLW